jgi:putative glutamine amidotransferase
MGVKIQISGLTGKMDSYIEAVLQAGGEPAAAYSPPPDPDCAALLLCGGGDLDPRLFGQENRGSHPPDPVQDEAELALVRYYLQAGKPVLGVCRGMQVINVALGGTLIQNLPPGTREKHIGQGGKDQIHPISLAPEGFLGKLYGTSLTVNSWHHQAVDRLGEGLRPSAWAPEGFVEALEHQSRPVYGVQFHPERMKGPEAGPGHLIFTVWMNRIRRSSE